MSNTSLASRLKVAAFMGLAMAIYPQQGHAQGLDLNGVITSILLPLLRSVVVLIFAGALVVFLYQVANYIGGAKPKDALEGMGMSLLTMFVMVSVWGLVRLLQATFPLENAAPQYPRI